MESDEKPITDVVKGWYTRTTKQEWERPYQDPYHQIEYITTMHFLNNIYSARWRSHR